VPDDPIANYGALFERDGERFAPTPLVRGPWDPRAQHGGAPSALLAWACEHHDPSPASFMAKLSVELLRPVPIAPLELRVRTLRPGKKVQWLESGLWDENGREVVHAVALRVRVDDIDTAGSVSPSASPPPGRDTHDGVPLFAMEERALGYWSANEVMLVQGSWMEPGPGAAWFRLRCPVVAGEPVSGFMRVAACADFGSGVGNSLRLTNAAAINPELTIHTHRHPEGEWVCLESGAWAEAHGVGMAESRLFDERGPLGRAVQTLLVERAVDRVMRGAE
jgi:hypothetical protein